MDGCLCFVASSFQKGYNIVMSESDMPRSVFSNPGEAVDNGRRPSISLQVLINWLNAKAEGVARQADALGDQALPDPIPRAAAVELAKALGGLTAAQSLLGDFKSLLQAESLGAVSGFEDFGTAGELPQDNIDM
jgi:hypothetical protein